MVNNTTGSIARTSRMIAATTPIPWPNLRYAEVIGTIRSELLCHQVGMADAETTLQRIRDALEGWDDE